MMHLTLEWEVTLTIFFPVCMEESRWTAVHSRAPADGPG